MNLSTRTLFALFALAASATAQTPTWSAEFIGAFPPAWTGNTVVQDFNDAGQVVGRTTLDLTFQAWYAEPGQDVQLLPVPAGTDYSDAVVINSSGLIGGTVRVNGVFAGCIWKPTVAGYQPELLPPVPNGGAPINVVGINDLGDVIGRHAPISRPYYWNETEGTVAIDSFLYPVSPVAINNERQIIGDTLRMDLDTGIVENLGNPTGVGYSFQFTKLGLINDAGDCAGYGVTGSSSSNFLPVRYSEGVGWNAYSTIPLNTAGVSGLSSTGDTVYQIWIFGTFVHVDGFGSIPLGSVLDPNSAPFVLAQVWPYLSRAGRLVALGTDPATGQTGLALLSPASFEDLGGASFGSLGTPILGGIGDLTPGSTTRLRLSSANKSALAFLAWSTTSSPLAAFDGVLHTNPVLGFTTVQVDPNGRSEWNLPWPALASGTPLYLQSAIVDPTATAGIALSNALLGTSR
jgi:hypothetical protein